jgi:hypothetical protein
LLMATLVVLGILAARWGAHVNIQTVAGGVDWDQAWFAFSGEFGMLEDWFIAGWGDEWGLRGLDFCFDAGVGEFAVASEVTFLDVMLVVVREE